MDLTQPYKELNQVVIGYMLNSPLSVINQNIIKKLQLTFTQEFGKTMWNIPVNSLHITLMDWVAPLVDYKKDKDSLFKDMFDTYDSSIVKLLSTFSTINVTFDSIHVSNGAIYISGTDSGQFQTIRNGFFDQVNLLPGTKQPPTIIHVTIARFINVVELKPIQEFAVKQSIHFIQNVNAFVLVRETKVPMLERTIIKVYQLNDT